MPFTPAHFGPGAAIKAVVPAHFSFAVFCYSQIVTDLEPAYFLLRGEYPVHRFFHTYPGAVLVGTFCAITGRPICQYFMNAVRCQPCRSYGARISYRGRAGTINMAPRWGLARGAFACIGNKGARSIPHTPTTSGQCALVLPARGCSRCPCALSVTWCLRTLGPCRVFDMRCPPNHLSSPLRR